MTGTLKTVCAAGLLIAFVSGCASVPKDAGFDDVRKIVAERTGKRVEWRQERAEDEIVIQAVQEMLKDELTQDRAVQIALLNNRRLQITYEDLGLAQANLVQAGLLRNPVFNAGILFGPTPADLVFGVVQDFLSILYHPLRRSVAEAEFEAAKIKVAGAVLDMAGQTRAVFYRAQAQVQTVEFQRQVVESTGAAYDAAKRLHDAGNITDLTLANERALYEETRLTLAEAELELAQGRERLNVLMGLWGTDTQWKINPRMPEIPNDTLDLNRLETRAIGASLDLAAARKRIESIARVLGLTNATALIPEFEVGAAFDRDDGVRKYGPTATLQIPIFDQGQARQAAAQSELRRAQQAYTAFAIEIRSAVRSARQAMEVSYARALHVKNVILPLRTKIVDDTLLQYNAMQVGIFQLLLSQQQQIAAGRQYIETLRDYWLTRTQLELILSGRLADMGSSAQPITTTSSISNMQTGGH
ncbi:MAG TPA: TolC family protein [Burkholderiales bacterium]|nr:TolC family protein [Burkholderiales bacterium]